jgi:ribonuclease P protein subunit POP4
MITPYNVLRHELIGLEARVADAKHPGYKTAGKIVKETKNTITIRNAGGDMTVPKDCVVLQLTLDNRTVVEVDGRLLLGRPEDRIKKKHRIRF